MTLSQIYPDRQLIVVRFSGPVGYDDMLQWMQEIREHESFSRTYDGLVDNREAIFHQTRPQKAQGLATYLIETDFTRGKWALLVDKPMETALSMLYSAVASVQHPIQVFSTLEGANQYLDNKLTDIELLAETTQKSSTQVYKDSSIPLL